MALKLHGAVGTVHQQLFVLWLLSTRRMSTSSFCQLVLPTVNTSHLSSLLDLNPFGQVPAFEHGDLSLFESRAITKYVAQTYADKETCLIFKDPKKSAIQSVWMEVENQKFDPAASKLSWELTFKPMYGKKTNEAVVAEFERKLERVLDVYEQRLTESKYLGGDSFVGICGQIVQ